MNWSAGLLALFLGFQAHATTANLVESETVKNFFALIADPKSTLDDIKASMAAHPVGLDAVYDSKTPSLQALTSRKNEIFRYFDQKLGSPSPNTPIEGTNSTVIRTALAYADWDMIQELRKRGGALKTKQDELVTICGGNTVDVCEKSLSLGNLNKLDSRGMLALSQAIRWNSKEMVAFLLKSGASVKLTEKDDSTPLLSLLYRKPDFEKYTMLMQAGADLKYKSKNLGTALNAAARYYPKEFIQSLIDQHFDLNSTDSDLETPLMAASMMGNPDAIQLLLVNGAKLNAKDSSGRSAIHFIGFSECNTAGLDMLLQAGAEINAKDKYQGAPLADAAQYSCLAVVNEMIAAGARLNDVDEFGKTALHWLAEDDK